MTKNKNSPKENKHLLREQDYLDFPVWPQDQLVPLQRGCPVCKRGSNGEVMTMVCTRKDCPTLLTC